MEDYLAGELLSPVKHEYVSGVVYAMAGARNVHNQIATNTAGALWSRLRGKPCRAFNSDTKIRIRLAEQVRFYYPDASVVCRLNPPDASFQDDPAVVIEVLSPQTRRTDEGEKRDAYLSIASLAAYILLEQDSPTAVVHRRTGTGFVREEYLGTEAVLPLGEVGVELPLAEVYDGIEFTAGPTGDDPA